MRRISRSQKENLIFFFFLRAFACEMKNQKNKSNKTKYTIKSTIIVQIREKINKFKKHIAHIFSV